MADRYFVASPIAGSRAIVEGPEAHHLLHVMRVAIGDEATLFDGSGAEFLARVVAAERKRVEFEILDRREVNRESSRDLTLAVALPKGDRQEWLVEKAVELGVRRLTPLVTRRGVAKPVPAALARLRRSVVEASKQCGRNRLLEIGEPVAWADFVRQVGPETRRLVAHPGGPGLRAAEWIGEGRPIVAAIGPEGGFDEAEWECAAAAGWERLNLGPRILRIETAALLVAALAVGDAAH